MDRSMSGVSREGGLGGGMEGGSRVDRSTGEYGSPKNAEGGVTCPGDGGMNWGGGGGGAVEGGGGIEICPPPRLFTETVPPLGRLSVLPVHGGYKVRDCSGKQKVNVHAGSVQLLCFLCVRCVE